MKKIWINKAYSFQEAEEFNRKFWRRAGATARFAAAWDMVGEYLKMKGKHGHKPRLRRDVVKLMKFRIKKKVVSKVT